MTRPHLRRLGGELTRIPGTTHSLAFRPEEEALQLELVHQAVVVLLRGRRKDGCIVEIVVLAQVTQHLNKYRALR